MTATPAVGTRGKMTVNANRQEFISENLRLLQTHFHSPGIRGTRSRSSNRVRITQEQVTGSITQHPTPTEIDVWLPLILGGVTSLGVTDVAETLTEFAVVSDRITKVFTYANCVVGSCTWSGSQGQPIQMVTNLEGETETVGAAGTGTFGALPTDNVFIFAHAALTLQGSARPIFDFNLSIDNGLDTGRYVNAITRTEIPSLDRIVRLTATLPYTSDNQDLHDQALAGAAASLVLTDGTTTYTIALGNVKAPADSPVNQGKQEIRLVTNNDAYHDGTNSEMKWTKS